MPATGPIMTPAIAPLLSVVRERFVEAVVMGDSDDWGSDMGEGSSVAMASGVALSSEAEGDGRVVDDIGVEVVDAPEVDS